MPFDSYGQWHDNQYEMEQFERSRGHDPNSQNSGGSSSSSSSSSRIYDPAAELRKPSKVTLSESTKASLRANDKGRSLMDNEDYDGAIAEFTKLINDNPSPGPYYLRGCCYYHKKDNGRAIADFNNALSAPNAVGFDYSNVFHNRGLSFLAMQEDQRAIDDFTKALELGIKHSVPDIYYFRGMCYFYIKKLAFAANDWRKAVSLARSNEQSHISAKKMLDENASAISEYEKIAKANFNEQLSNAKNGSVDGCFNVGKSYEDGFGVSQDLNEAIKWYKKAAEKGDKEAKEKVKELENKISPSSTPSSSSYSAPSSSSSSPSSSASAPTRQSSSSYSSTAEAKNGNWESKIENWYRNYAANPNNVCQQDDLDTLAEYYKNRGDAYQEKGNTAKANADYQRAVNLASIDKYEELDLHNETNAEALFTHGIEEYNANHYAVAVHLLKLSANDGHSGAKAKLNEIKNAVGGSSSTSYSSSSTSKKASVIGAVIGAVIIGILPGFGFIRIIIGAAVGYGLGLLFPKIKKLIIGIFVVAIILGGGYFAVSKFAPNLLSSIKNKTVTTVAAAETKTVTVKNEALNLRAEASTNSEILKKLKKGDVLNVIGEAVNGWLPVEHEGTKGHVSGDMVE